MIKFRKVYEPHRAAAGQCHRRSALWEQSLSVHATNSTLERRQLTDEEQSLLDLRRVRLPPMISHVRKRTRQPSYEAELLRHNTVGVVLDCANYRATR